MESDVKEKIRQVEAELELIRQTHNQGTRKWFKDPSLLLSIVALLTSAVFSIFSMNIQRQEKKAESFQENVKSVEDDIESLVEQEENFYNTLSNQTLSNDAKSNFEFLWNAKSNLFLDKIYKKYEQDSSLLNSINPNLLLQLGKNLMLAGRIEKAKDVYQIALDQSEDYTTSLIAHRHLANIYAIPSDFQDSAISRMHRKKDIAISKEKLKGEYAWESISRSFELWANDEFNFFQETKKGNQFIDSSLFYSNLLSKLNFKKTQTQERLLSLKSFYNDGINKYSLKEHWKVSSTTNKLSGEARIYQNANGIFCTIHLFQEGTLQTIYSGSGYAKTSNELVFEMHKNTYISTFNIENGFGVMKLRFNHSAAAQATFSQLGKTPETLTLW